MKLEGQARPTPTAGDALALSQGSAGFAGWNSTALDYPTFRLLLLAKVMDRITLRTFPSRTGVTISEWRVLSWLCAGGELTVGQIAERACSDRAEISRAATALEAKGWVERRANLRDRRSPLLTASEIGRARFEPLLEQRRAFHLDALGELSPLERDLLDALLAKVAKSLVVMEERGPVPLDEASRSS